MASGAAGLEFIPTTNSVANGGFTVQESTTANSGGLVGTTTTTTISINGTQAVDLSSYYNVTGITTDGTSFGSGIDGQGNALSRNRGRHQRDLERDHLRPRRRQRQRRRPRHRADDRSAGGQLFQRVVSGRRHQRQPTQPAIHHQLLRRHFDDRDAKHQRLGHAARLCGRVGRADDRVSQHLATAAGAAGTFDVYGYSIAVDPTKTVESITLPNDANVKILSIATQATLDAPTNLTATAAVERQRQSDVDGLGQHRHRLQRLSLYGRQCRVADAASAAG